MASPGQPITASNYSASGHTAPAQQVLQPQTYMQPPQQVSCSTGYKGSASIGLSSAMVFLGYRAEWYSPPVYIPLKHRGAVIGLELKMGETTTSMGESCSRDNVYYGYLYKNEKAIVQKYLK